MATNGTPSEPFRELTPEQLAAIDERTLERALASTSATGTDEELSERAIAQLYQDAGFDTPQFVWCDSPAQIAALSAFIWLHSCTGGDRASLDECADQLTGQWWQTLLERYRQIDEHELEGLRTWFGRSDSLSRNLSNFKQVIFQNEVEARYMAALTSHLRQDFKQSYPGYDLFENPRSETSFLIHWRFPNIALQIAAHARRTLIEKVVPELLAMFTTQLLKSDFSGDAHAFSKKGKALINSQIERMNFGAWHHPRLYRALSVNDLMGAELFRKETRGDLRLAEQVFCETFASLMLPHLCIVSQRPAKLTLDDRLRLHDEQSPAASFEDGSSFYSWHGTTVPETAIKSRDTLNLQTIMAEGNSVTRRALIEIFGSEKFLLAAQAEAIHSDECGVLYRVPLPGDEPLVMVKVINSTPEPDGTFKSYYLRVPPNTTTARAAVSWTFGMRPDEYLPDAQT